MYENEMDFSVFVQPEIVQPSYWSKPDSEAAKNFISEDERSVQKGIARTF